MDQRKYRGIRRLVVNFTVYSRKWNSLPGDPEDIQVTGLSAGTGNLHLDFIQVLYTVSEVDFLMLVSL